SPGDSQWGPRYEHVRSFDFTGVDAVAHGDVGIVAGAHVTHCSKACTQREPRVLHADHRLAWRGDAKSLVAAMRRIAGKLCVAIEKARQARCAGQLDHRRGAGSQW